MPNQDTPEVGGARWAKYLTSVAQIEKATGYKFFTALAPDVQRALKAKTDSGRASAADSTSGAGDAGSEAFDGRSASSVSSGIPIPTPGDPGMIRSEIPDGARRQPRSPLGSGGGSDGGSASGAEARGGQPYAPPMGDGRTEPQSQQQPATGGQVWVNTKTGVYHYPGARWYGNTKQGAYMSEAEANSHGYRAAANGQ